MQATADGGRPSDVDERKALMKAQAAQEEAQRKLEATKKWAMALDREFLLYRGQVQQLGRVLDADLPKAIIKLERMVMALEKYVLERAPDAEQLLRRTTQSSVNEIESAAPSRTHEPADIESPLDSEANTS